MPRTAIIGFDSAWADNPKAPGAICALIQSEDQQWEFDPPRSALFDQALELIREREQQFDRTVIAIDQPIIVPNEQGCRPVDRIAGAVVGWAGGGVQPANRSKDALFGNGAPIWRFKSALGAAEDPEQARASTKGLFLIEVFPALALPSMSEQFCGRNKGPRYNPKVTKQFNPRDWQAVIELVAELADRYSIENLREWCRGLQLMEPSKSLQDQLDSVICALIAFQWLEMPPNDSLMLGDETHGYMITPVNPVTKQRLLSKVEVAMRTTVEKGTTTAAHSNVSQDQTVIPSVVLTQVQIIQSLAEALTWFEKEINWGVAPAQLNHLTGRIGELYAAMITRGQMALQTNQHGYDVISANNDRISVKTVTTSTHVTFNPATFSLVDRVMILRINVDEETGVSVEIIADERSEDLLPIDAKAGRIIYRIPASRRQIRSLDQLQVVAEAAYEDKNVRQYENGSVAVLVGGEPVSLAKPLLRDIAAAIGVDILNGSSQPKNTRQLGADVIKTLKARGASFTDKRNLV